MNFIFILISSLILGFTQPIIGTRGIFLIVAILSIVMIVYIALKLDGIKDSIKRLLKI
jgi:hypothetical protein